MTKKQIITVLLVVADCIDFLATWLKQRKRKRQHKTTDLWVGCFYPYFENTYDLHIQGLKKNYIKNILTEGLRVPFTFKGTFLLPGLSRISYPPTDLTGVYEVWDPYCKK